jgi:hypothetical protein
MGSFIDGGLRNDSQPTQIKSPNCLDFYCICTTAGWGDGNSQDENKFFDREVQSSIAQPRRHQRVASSELISLKCGSQLT